MPFFSVCVVLEFYGKIEIVLFISNIMKYKSGEELFKGASSTTINEDVQEELRRERDRPIPLQERLGHYADLGRLYNVLVASADFE